jgi:hypothetical protein
MEAFQKRLLLLCECPVSPSMWVPCGLGCDCPVRVRGPGNGNKTKVLLRVRKKMKRVGRVVNMKFCEEREKEDE